MTHEQEIERAKVLLKQNGYHVYEGRRVLSANYTHRIELFTLLALQEQGVEEKVTEDVKNTMALHLGRLIKQGNAIAWHQLDDYREWGRMLRADIRVIVPHPALADVRESKPLLGTRSPKEHFAA